MKRNFQILLLILLISLGFFSAASAQWQWEDEAGRSVYSDRPPPVSVPRSKIIKQPRGSEVLTVRPAAKSAEQSTSTGAAKKEAAPKADSIDPELQKKLDEETKAKAKDAAAIAEYNTQVKANNCATARRAIAELEPGRRIATVNDKGETGYMSDDVRQQRQSQAQKAIQENCP